MNVDLELRRGIGHCRECCDRRELSGLKIKTGAAVHVPEGKLDQIRREVRRNIVQTCNDAFPLFPINFSQLVQTPLVAITLHKSSLSLQELKNALVNDLVGRSVIPSLVVE